MPRAQRAPRARAPRAPRGKRWWRRGKGGSKGGRKGSGKGYGSRLVECTDEVEEEEVEEAPQLLLEQLSLEQRRAFERAMQGENLFLTGAAGTGKSFLLRYLIQELEKAYPGKVAVTASTGVAASHLAGQTLHSFAGVGIGRVTVQTALKKVRRNRATALRWQETRVLIVDEISMVDASFLEALEGLARGIRQRKEAFGGIQVLFCGDFLQLPPVQERGARKKSFCFTSKAWTKAKLNEGTVVLREAVRQQGDGDFAKVLNEMRVGVVTEKAKHMLASCHVKVKQAPEDNILPTKLYCLNKDVNKENASRLAQLPGEAVLLRARDKLRRRVTVQQLQGLEKKVPKELSLKVGAQVIHLCNDPSLGLVNGHRGRVEAFQEGKPVVRFDNGKRVCIGVHKFTQGQGTSSLTRFQVPLKLGWALTVHKAQGMTLTRAELQVDDAFEAGQSYVALSRLTGTAGLWIRGNLRLETCRAHPEVLQFYEEAEKRQSAAVPAVPMEAAAMRALPGPQGKRPASALLERLLKRARPGGKDSPDEDGKLVDAPPAERQVASVKVCTDRWLIPLKEWTDPIEID